MKEVDHSQLPFSLLVSRLRLSIVAKQWRYKHGRLVASLTFLIYCTLSKVSVQISEKFTKSFIWLNYKIIQQGFLRRVFLRKQQTIPKFASIGTNNGLKLRLDIEVNILRPHCQLNLEPLFREHWSEFGKCLHRMKNSIYRIIK